MKIFNLFIVLVCFCAFAKAQNIASDTSVVVDRLEIKLELGERQEINTVEITFLEVLEDSRCPKDVSCVWAGQAKIKVLIQEKDTAPVEKEFIFDASGKNVFIYKSETIAIKALRLSPYPKTSLAIKKRVYYLELQA
ncbi:hypothetical protein [Dokdonia sp.]|uniref:hypothetical protein n=1 Tax=Dokdonia sp. TaxID=2024995 RepID=UPI003266DEB5